MRIIKFRKWYLVAIIFIFILTLCTTISFITLKIRNISVYNELSEKRKNSKKDDVVVSYEEYKKNVINEYKGKKVLALTFDDGPHSKYTPKLLAILKKYDAKATFFILGSCVAENEEIIKTAYSQGNEIATHGYSHKIMTKLSTDALIKDIKLSLDAINPNISEEITLLRPPYGIVNEKVMKTLNKFGLTCIKWDLDSLDWKLRNTNKITERVLKQVSDKKIILMHDIYKTSVEAVECILQELKDEYSFVTVSELMILKEAENIN